MFTYIRCDYRCLQVDKLSNQIARWAVSNGMKKRDVCGKYLVQHRVEAIDVWLHTQTKIKLELCVRVRVRVRVGGGGGVGGVMCVCVCVCVCACGCLSAYLVYLLACCLQSI